MTKTFQKIYNILVEYFIRSNLMLNRGFPWVVVLSFHEIFRNLYPTEPYIKNYSINDEDRPEYLLGLIQKQLDLFSAVESGVFPYENMFLDKLRDLHDDEKSLSVEDRTLQLYGCLWERFGLDEIIREARELLEKRIDKQDFVLADLKNKTVLDMGCGSGRYSIALSSYGCRSVVGCDIGTQGINVGRKIAKRHQVKNTRFVRGDVLNLTFYDESFDFVFCNGVLHHAVDLKMGLHELFRVLKTSRKAYLYLYGAKGLFWNFRKKMREVIRKVPREYAQYVLTTIGLPSNRFIFMDTWYVPIENHTSKEELEDILLNHVGFKSIVKLISKNKTDIDAYIASDRPYAKELYGDGEHRYLLTK